MTDYDQDVKEEYVQMLLETDDGSHLLGDEGWKEVFVRELVNVLTDNTDFSISAKTIAELLQRREDNVRQSIIKELTEGKDYIFSDVREVIKKGRGKKKTEEVLLSADGFAKIAQVLRGDRARALRGYFVLVEKMFRENTLDAVMDRRRTEDETVTQLKMRPWSRKGQKRWEMGHCVYVIRVQDGDQVKFKVGRSKDLNRRFGELKRHIPGDLSVAHQRMIEEHVFLEVCTHKMLKNSRLDKEVEMFETNIEKVLRALDICERHNKELNNEMAALEAD